MNESFGDFEGGVYLLRRGGEGKFVETVCDLGDRLYVQMFD